MSIYKGKQNYSLGFMKCIARLEHTMKQHNKELRKLTGTHIVFRLNSAVWF